MKRGARAIFRTVSSAVCERMDSICGGREGVMSTAFAGSGFIEDGGEFAVLLDCSVSGFGAISSSRRAITSSNSLMKSFVKRN